MGAEKARALTKLSSALLAYGLAGLLIAIWVSAFLHPTDSVVVYINRHGEKWPELALWGVLIPLLVVGAYLHVRDYLTGRET